MAASTNKRVQIWRFDRQTIPGFINPGSYLTETAVEVLSPSGLLSAVPIAEAKAVCFVREWDPELELKRKFLNRPKLDGLWVRLVFRDGDFLEGVMPNDLLGLNGEGVGITPPDFSGNIARLYIPRSALTAVAVLGVVHSPQRRKKPAREEAVPKDQIALFE